MSKASSANTQIEVQGHRGARAVLPENTLAAFEYALELGVDTLELDMGVTKDGAVIVVHDQKINPVICQFKDGRQIEDDLWIHQMSLSEIKEIDCGTKINPRFADQHPRAGSEIPTLEEVFRLVEQSPLEKAKTVLFNIETKSDPSIIYAQPSPQEFVKAVLAVVEKFDLSERVCIQSFDHRTLIETYHLAPQMLTSALFDEAPKDWVKATAQAKANIVSPDFKLIDSESVTTMQQAGLRVIPWTANHARDWDNLIELNVDGIITDDPQALLEHLGRL